MAVKNSESRKLKLFARHGDFNASVDAITCLAFIEAASITVSEKKSSDSDAK